jgi:hypothetical protein
MIPWRTADTWPPAGGEKIAFYLHPDRVQTRDNLSPRSMLLRGVHDGLLTGPSVGVDPMKHGLKNHLGSTACGFPIREYIETQSIRRGGRYLIANGRVTIERRIMELAVLHYIPNVRSCIFLNGAG